MIYRIYGQKDSTIYEPTARKAQNTGKDEILEVTKFFDDLDGSFTGNSRILTQFDITELSQSIASGDITGSEFILNLTSTEEIEIPAEYTLDIYPVSESWDVGLGQFYDNPINTNGVSWERRNTTTLWNVGDAQILNDGPPPVVPSKGIVLYEGFSDGSGSAFLTESINDISGNSPTLTVQNNRLVISASNFAGTTLVFPVELSASVTYGVQFQIDPGDFDDIAFRIEDPNGVLKTEGDYENLVGRITTASTQSFTLTADASGDHDLRFTFFDGEISGTTTKGFFDEIYVYQKDEGLLVWETFTPKDRKSVV